MERQPAKGNSEAASHEPRRYPAHAIGLEVVKNKDGFQPGRTF